MKWFAIWVAVVVIGMAPVYICDLLVLANDLTGYEGHTCPE